LQARCPAPVPPRFKENEMRSIALTPAPSVFAETARIPALAAAGAARIAGRVFATLIMWQRRHDQRRQMAHLDPRLMADIGLTATAVRREVQKPFWLA
jgi:uncharacterized protein YjiS (DUF1127 family)